MEFIQGDEKFQIENEFLSQFKPKKIETPDPPVGYEWKFNNSNKKQIMINLKLEDCDKSEKKNKMSF